MVIYKCMGDSGLCRYAYYSAVVLVVVGLFYFNLSSLTLETTCFLPAASRQNHREIKGVSTSILSEIHKNKRLHIVDQNPSDPLTYSPCFLTPKLKVSTRSKCTMFL